MNITVLREVLSRYHVFKLSSYRVVHKSITRDTIMAASDFHSIFVLDYCDQKICNVQSLCSSYTCILRGHN